MTLILGCQPGEQVMRGTGEGVRKNSSFVRVLNLGSQQALIKDRTNLIGGRVAQGEFSEPVPTRYGESRLTLLLGPDDAAKEVKLSGEFESGEVHTVVVFADGTYVITAGEPRRVEREAPLAVRVVEPGNANATLESPLDLKSSSGTVKVEKGADAVTVSGDIELALPKGKALTESLDPEWATTLVVVKGAPLKAFFLRNGKTIAPSAAGVTPGG
jgi:hypothetical protein